MKKMELRICVTFAIFFVVGVILNGLYSVISCGESFFSFNVMAQAIASALVYLFYIWLFTRRYKLLTGIGLSSIFLCLLLANSSSGGVANSFSNFTWLDVATIIYAILAFFIAFRDAKELLEESKQAETFIFTDSEGNIYKLKMKK